MTAPSVPLDHSKCTLPCPRCGGAGGFPATSRFLYRKAHMESIRLPDGTYPCEFCDSRGTVGNGGCWTGSCDLARSARVTA